MDINLFLQENITFLGPQENEKKLVFRKKQTMSNTCISVITKLEKNNSAKLKQEDPVLYDIMDSFTKSRPKNVTTLSIPLPSKSLATHLSFSGYKARGKNTSKNVTSRIVELFAALMGDRKLN